MKQTRSYLTLELIKSISLKVFKKTFDIKDWCKTVLIQFETFHFYGELWSIKFWINEYKIEQFQPSGCSVNKRGTSSKNNSISWLEVSEVPPVTSPPVDLRWVRCLLSPSLLLTWGEWGASCHLPSLPSLIKVSYLQKLQAIEDDKWLKACTAPLRFW